jgi:hypothetical protein
MNPLTSNAVAGVDGSARISIPLFASSKDLAVIPAKSNVKESLQVKGIHHHVIRIKP